MGEISVEINLSNERESFGLGAKISSLLKAGDCLLLSGDLGAGKTTFCRGLIQNLCGAQDVPSPTYTLVQIYEGQMCEIWHMDLYRLDQPSDIWELGVEDAFDDAICLIEWPEQAQGLLPDTALHIRIEFEGEGRKAILTGEAHWQALLASFTGKP